MRWSVLDPDVEPGATALLEDGVRVVDIGADFRLRDPSLYPQWYDLEHSAPELLEEAVYGLPEMNREAIASARLIACPGCYPTAATLALLPLLRSVASDPDAVTAETDRPQGAHLDRSTPPAAE